jgi:ribosomal protein L37AE/L43A
MIITGEQARAILADLPKPDKCDACSSPFLVANLKRQIAYGPFTVFVCPKCDWKIKKSEYRRRQLSK